MYKTLSIDYETSPISNHQRFEMGQKVSPILNFEVEPSEDVFKGIKSPVTAQTDIYLGIRTSNIQRYNHTKCMYIVCPIEYIVCENIHFLDTRKNVIIDGNFTKLYYSDSSVSLNALYIDFPIHVSSLKSSNNFITFLLTNEENLNLIKRLIKLEMEILNYYKLYFGIQKEKSLSLQAQLKRGNLKLYHTTSENGCHPIPFILKISGVWETDNQIGITYKFIK